MLTSGMGIIEPLDTKVSSSTHVTAQGVARLVFMFVSSIRLCYLIMHTIKAVLIVLCNMFAEKLESQG